MCQRLTRRAYRMAMLRRPSGVVRPQFQRSSPLKPLGQSKPNSIGSLYMEGERKYIQVGFFKKKPMKRSSSVTQVRSITSNFIHHPRLPRCDPLRQTSFITMNVGYGMQCAWVTEDGDECRLRNAVRLGDRGCEKVSSSDIRASFCSRFQCC